MIEVQLRLATISGKQQYGFVINIARNWIFDKNCSTLNSEGYNLLNVEVLHSEIYPGSGGILTPNEEFVGTILELINDETAKVLTNEGEQEFPLTELFIRKTKFNIANYLDFVLTPEKTTQILDQIEDKKHEIYNTRNLHGEICEIAKALFTSKLDGHSIEFKNKDGFYFIVQDKPLQVTNTFDLKTPTFIFDPAGTKTNNTNPDIGLSNFGPYDSINFDIKSPSILCICHRENRGYFSKFLADLKDGIPNSRYFKKSTN